jgi:hypothetical protein
MNDFWQAARRGAGTQYGQNRAESWGRIAVMVKLVQYLAIVALLLGCVYLATSR